MMHDGYKVQLLNTPAPKLVCLWKRQYQTISHGLSLDSLIRSYKFGATSVLSGF